MRAIKSFIAGLGVMLALAFGYVLIASLAPSDRADAVRAQWRIAASALDELSPGEIRTAHTELGPVFVVVPDARIREMLESQSNTARFPAVDTYDPDHGAFLVWGIVHREGATACTAIYREPGGFIPEPGDIYDPCGGARFDLAGRVLLDSNHERLRNLRRPILERVGEDEYQIVGLSE